MDNRGSLRNLSFLSGWAYVQIEERVLSNRDLATSILDLTQREFHGLFTFSTSVI